MTSEKVIERLKAKNWYVKCENNHEYALVLNACHDAGITWYSGLSTLNSCLEFDEPFQFTIGMMCGFSTGILWAEGSAKWRYLCDDITDWFFNEINK